MRSVLTPRVTRVPRGPPSEPGIADSGFPVACALAWTKIYVPPTYPARGTGCRADTEERGGYECRNQTFPYRCDLYLATAVSSVRLQVTVSEKQKGVIVTVSCEVTV